MKTLIIVALALVVCGMSVSANPTLNPGVWTEITPAALRPSISSGSLVAYELAIDPGNPSTLYANTNGTGNAKLFWKTTDGGANWENIGDFGGTTQGVGFGRIRIDPKNSDHLYTGIEMGETTSADGFWVSTDGGNNWTRPAGWTTLCQGITSGNFTDVYDLAVDPSDFNHVLASSRSWVAVVAESKDGGATWKSIEIPGANGNDYNIDFLSAPARGVGNGNTWLVSCPSGIWRTSDAGTNWSKINTSFQIMYHTGIYYSNTGALYMGGYPLPLKSNDNGITWQQITTGLSPFGSYFVIVGDGTTLYTAHTNVWTFPNSGSVQISPESDGLTWTDYKPSGTAQQITNGPLSMAYDSLNHIMYSANVFGFMAMKIPGSTVTINGVMPQAKLSGVKKQTSMVTSNDELLFLRSSQARPGKLELFDLKGSFTGRPQAH